jgi:DNA invertase Pin-like site-specific DNA recombinase
VSTEEQAASGAGLAAQREQLQLACRQRGWELVAIHQDTGSGKNTRRPDLQRALALLRGHQADGLVVSKLDRLSRSVRDFTTLAETAMKQGWAIVVLDLGVDTSTPNGEMLANILVSFAQFERRLIGQRTKEALAAKRAAGVRLGRPVEMSEVAERLIVTMRKDGRSLENIAAYLNMRKLRTAHGGKWHGSTVRVVLRRHPEVPRFPQGRRPAVAVG